MKITKHQLGPLLSNCYVAWDETSREGLVIDPGSKSVKPFLTVEKEGLIVRGVFQTHHHWDHVAGAWSMAKTLKVPLLRHPADPKTGFLGRRKRADGERVIDIEDGHVIRLGAAEFIAIHTPGHTPGGLCLYGDGVLFSGDLLFKTGVGRTDLKGGDTEELLISLAVRLAALPDHVDVLPGHGPPTTMGAERRRNPWFRAANALALEKGLL